LAGAGGDWGGLTPVRWRKGPAKPQASEQSKRRRLIGVLHGYALRG